MASIMSGWEGNNYIIIYLTVLLELCHFNSDQMKNAPFYL